jgi:hypothetical protein
VIVNNFNLVCVARAKHEAESEAIVNPNAPLADAIACEFFKAISRWNAQELEPCRCVQEYQFPSGTGCNVRWNNSISFLFK